MNKMTHKCGRPSMELQIYNVWMWSLAHKMDEKNTKCWGRKHIFFLVVKA
jgi:hypothetical protein